jgi:glycosyltransferase involved in cell wall biosynthesis
VETLRFLMVSTFYPPHHLGGDAIHVKYLSEALVSRGHEVHVEYSPAAYRAKRGLLSNASAPADPRVNLHPIPERLRISGPAAAYMLGESRTANRFHERLVREVRPDVVHLHNISLLGLGVQRRLRTGPLIYTAHDYWFRCPRSDLLKNGVAPCQQPSCFTCMLRSRRIPPAWRNADVAHRFDAIDGVLAPSRFLGGLASASFRCPVVHIPNFTPDDNPEGTIEPASPYYVYVGVLEKHKGVDRLAEAAERARTERRIVFVGRGSLEPRLRALAREHPSRMEVRSGIDRQALADLLRRAAAFVMPSIWYENAPLAAIEALSWGSPLLVTSRGGAPELIDGGAAGLTLEPTMEGILSALATFESLGESEPMRAAARRAYQTHHQPGPYLNRYLSVIRSLASGESPAVAQDPARERLDGEGLSA